MITTKHAFRGNLIACLSCFKKKSDPIHQIEDYKAVDYSSNHIFLEGKDGRCVTCTETALHPIHGVNSTRANCIQCSRPFDFPLNSEVKICDSCQTVRDLLTNATVLEQAVDSPRCSGHACSKCGGQWQHEYACKRLDDVLGLCSNCAQQNASEINRPQHIEEIKVAHNSERIMTNAEQRELMIQHEEFVVMNILYNPSKDNPSKPDLSNPKEDGMQKLAEHIMQLERIQLQCRIKEQAARSARTKKEVQDLNTLSPEEQEQYKRDAAKMKKAGAGKPKKEKIAKTSEPVSGTKRDKALVSMLKLMGKADTPDNRRLVEELLGD